MYSRSVRFAVQDGAYIFTMYNPLHSAAIALPLGDYLMLLRMMSLRATIAVPRITE
jgi:hypothetical protein